MKQKNNARLRRLLLRGFSLLAAVVGFVALLGWLFDLPLLTTFGSSLIPMAPSTAIFFILLGTGTFFHSRVNTNRRLYYLGLGIGVFIAILSLLLFILSSMGIYLDAEHVGFQITTTLNGTTVGHMSPVTALLFFLVSLSFIGLLTSPGRLLWSKVSLGLAIVIILVSYIFALAYLAGLPLLYGGQTIPPSLPASLAFLSLGVALFMAAQSQARFQEKSGETNFANVPAILLILFGFLSLSIITFGYVYYRNYERQLRLQVEGQLSAIAELKISQLENWRFERIADAEVIHQNQALADLVQAYLAHPNDARSKGQIQDWLDTLESEYKYDRVSLLDSTYMERISSPSDIEPVNAFLASQAASAMTSGQVTFLDFHRDTPDSPIDLALLVPITSAGDVNHPLGLLVLRIDPNIYLYPFLQQWPLPSTTAETLLVRRDGNSVLFLNELRFQQDTALSLRFPLTDTDILAVKAVSGQEGVVQGLDYRGHAVIGYVGPVPGSPWFIVARMDLAEANAPLTARLWQTVVIFGMMILASGAGLVTVWRQQRVRFYRAQAGLAEELRNSEVRYRRLFEAARDGILILEAETGMVLDVNPFLVEMLGFPREAICGKELWDMGFFKDIAANKANFLELQQKEYIRYEDLPLETADGRSLHVEFVSNVYQVDRHKVVQCNIRDITDRRQAKNMIEARLRLVEFSAHHSLEELLQNTLDEVCAITESPIGFYHFVEPDQNTLSLQAWSTRTLREYCQAEGSGLHYNLDTAGVWADCLRQRKPVIHNDYAALPHQKGLPAGHAVLVRELVVPILRDGLVVAILGVGNNTQEYTEKDVETITFFADVAWELVKRKRAELELTQYAEKLEEKVQERTVELRAAQEKLVRQERLATLGQVAGSIGHELRNPLGVISNAIYFLKMAQPDASDKVKEYLQIIENETRTSNKFITELLDFTRIKALDRKPVLVPVLINQALERYPVSQNVELSVNLPADLPPVYADPQHILQVLGNLTVNASQAMHDIGKLTIFASEDNDMISIAVQDTGEGISPKNMSKLFEPLFTTKVKGVGLGLAVCKKLAESNGGRIEVHSELGVGSTFTIFLPVYRP